MFKSNEWLMGFLNGGDVQAKDGQFDDESLNTLMIRMRKHANDIG